MTSMELSSASTGTGTGTEAVRLNLRQSVQGKYLGSGAGSEYALFERAQRRLHNRKTAEVLYVQCMIDRKWVHWRG